MQVLRMSWLLGLWLVFGVALTAYSQAPVEVVVHPKNGTVDEPFRLSVVVRGDAAGRPQIPQVAGLEIREAGQSSNYSWVNGRSSREVVYSYQIVADKPGSYTIPSLSMQVDGQPVQTEPARFQVGAPSSSVGGGDTNGTDGPPLVFVTRQLSSKEPMVGEAVPYQVKIYYRIDINNPARVNQPSPDLRLFETDQNQSREMYNGTVYDVITLDEVLVPLKSGKVEVPPFKISLHVAVPDEPKRRRHPAYDDFFSDFFGRARRRMVKKVVASDPDILHVQPFPQGSAPAGFTGTVGDFTVAASLSQDRAKVGDTTTLTITVEGSGLLDSVGKLPYEAPNGIKVYADKPEIVEQPRKDFGVYSKRVYRFALVPTVAGTFDLGDISLPVFSVKSRRYEVLTTSLPNLAVEAAAGESQVVVAAGTTATTVKSEVKSLATDLIDIHRDVGALTKPAPQGMGQWFYLLLGLPFGFWLLCLVWMGWQQRTVNHASVRRSRAYRHFKRATAGLTGQEAAQALQSYYNAYRDFIGDKLDARGAALTQRDIDDRLQRLGLSEADRAKARDLAKTVDQIAYQGRAFGEAQLADYVASVDALVGEIERRC